MLPIKHYWYCFVFLNFILWMSVLSKFHKTFSTSLQQTWKTGSRVRHLSLSHIYLTFSFLVSAKFQVCRSPYYQNMEQETIFCWFGSLVLKELVQWELAAGWLPGISEKNLFRSLYLYTVNAAPSFHIRISFNNV